MSFSCQIDPSMTITGHLACFLCVQVTNSCYELERRPRHSVFTVMSAAAKHVDAMVTLKADHLTMTALCGWIWVMHLQHHQ